MKTEKEIREKILEYTQIIGRSSIFTREFELANGARTALMWVLDYGNIEEFLYDFDTNSEVIDEK